MAGQDGIGVDGRAVSDQLQALECGAHPFPAAAVDGSHDHVRPARSPAPSFLEHRGRDAAPGCVAEIDADSIAHLFPRSATYAVR